MFVPAFHRIFTTININIDGRLFLLLFVYVLAGGFSFYLLPKVYNFFLSCILCLQL
jgi:hypothetical protein